MRTIFTEKAPSPAGHYSQAVVHGGLVFVSGMLPARPDGTRETASAAAQTAQALANLEAALRAAGAAPETVLKTTIYVADISLWDEVNAAYAAFFKEHRPARSVVPVKELHFGFLVEIEAVAAVLGE